MQSYVMHMWVRKDKVVMYSLASVPHPYKFKKLTHMNIYTHAHTRAHGTQTHVLPATSRVLQVSEHPLSLQLEWPHFNSHHFELKLCENIHKVKVSIRQFTKPVQRLLLILYLQLTCSPSHFSSSSSSSFPSVCSRASSL